MVSPFTDGLQSHQPNGEIEFGYGGRVEDNPNRQLPATSIGDAYFNPFDTCNDGNCVASGTPAAAWALGDDFADALEETVNVPSGQSKTLAPSTTIKRLSVGYNATLKLRPGDYWIGRLSLGSHSHIEVDGEGRVRLFVREQVRVPWRSRLNSPGAGEEGDPSKLLLFSKQGVQLQSFATVSGLIYTPGRYSQQFNSTLYGAANFGSGKLGLAATAFYRSNAVQSADSAGLCQTPQREEPDRDGDGVPDNDDDDIDGDGISNELEAIAGTNPMDPSSTPEDVDGNGIPDSLEPHDRANACVATYPNAAQTHSGQGVVTLRNSAQLHDTPIPVLYSPTVDVNTHSGIKSCGDAHCEAIGFPVEPPAIGPFQAHEGNARVRLRHRESRTLGHAGERDFARIRSSAESQLTLAGDNPDYRIGRLDLGHKATLRLPAGDYWIGRLKMGAESAIEVVGEGTVRLNIKQQMNVPWSGKLNVASQDPSKLIINHFDRATFQNGSETHAIVYARDDIRLHFGATIHGAATGKNVTLNPGSQVYFDQEAVSNADFGARCDIDGDGIYDGLDPDRDGDGIDNDYETELGFDPNDPNSTPPDMDGDGIPDSLDSDRDGDGHDNEDDAFPDDPDEWSDLDGDGVGDNSDPDRDGDGISNDLETELGFDPNDATNTPPDLDGDGLPDSLDDDRDGDGHANEDDVFPDNPGEWSDLDGDGVGDNSDPDLDGDGINNDYETKLGFDPEDPASTPPDMDGDGVPDSLDRDRDGDGHENNEDAFPNNPSEWSDLDGDGIGDNSDPDRDGDGFDNTVENNRGTDPNDAGDYPDDVPPNLHVNNTDGEELEQKAVTLTGTVSDPEQPYSGVDRVTVTSDRYADATFAANRTGGTFEAEIPLALGANHLTLTAHDLSGNTTVVERAFKRVSPPHFANVTPANGSVVTEQSVTIAGEVRTYIPLSDVQFFIDEWQITPTGTGQEGVYRFSLPDIPLAIGSNYFTLRTVNPDGVDERTLVLQHKPEDADQIPAPDIELLAPSEGSLLNSASFRIKGRVTSHAGSVDVTLNGDAVDLEGTDDAGFFEGIVSFPEGADEVVATVTATDSVGKSRESSFHFNRDDQAPRIVVDGGLSEAPTLNPVFGSPVRFSGTVIDTNLASLQLNGQPVRLRPGANEGEYEFGVALNVAPGEERPVALKANDRGGNTTSVEYRLKSDDTLSLSLDLPRANTRLVVDGEAPDVDVAARLSRRPDGIAARARVGGGSNQPLELNDTLASGTLTLPAEAGRHRITVEIVGADNTILASTSRYVETVDAADIPLEVVRSEPAANATNVEPNAAVELHFSKALDPAKLTVEVLETLHGRTYVNDDAPGTNFLEAKGAELEAVHRDRVPVPGEITLMPGNRGLAFFPARHYGFNAQIYIEVGYDGETLERYRFKVRPLPTFITGGLNDQFGQPLAGVDVTLPELGLATETNDDGAFSFGFNARPDERIPGGRHELVINPGFKTPGYGSERTTVSVQSGRRNQVGVLQVPELSDNAPFQRVSASQQRLSLAGGDLAIDVSNAQLLFQQGRTSGEIQVQFFPFSHLAVEMMPGFTPLWAYATQPRGVEVDGPVGLRIKMPRLRGGYDYIPEGTERVVLLGLDTDRDVLAPVGIGRIDNHIVISDNGVDLDTLDTIAFAIVPPRFQPLLEAVAAGEKSLNQLIAELQ